jgi:ABC-type multidrug transport system fused ATPase/permease subunit
VVTQPGIVQTNQYFHEMYVLVGSPEIQRFLYFLGLLILVSLLISNLVSVLVTWLLLRFSHMVGFRFSRRIFDDYLHRPFDFFLGRNSAELSKNILSETDRATRGVLLPMLQVLARGVSIAFIIGLLIIADPFIAMSVGITLGIAYLGIYLAVRRKAFRLGKLVTEATRRRFKITSEAFGVVKYLKLTGMEDRFTERFAQPSLQYAKSHASSRAMAQLPKYLLEIVAFGGILVIVLHVISARGAVTEAMSLLGLYAFAGYRLLPQLQQVFEVATSLRFNMPALEVLLADFDQCDSGGARETTQASGDPVTLTASLRLKHVTYSYPNAETPTIANLDMTILAGTMVGLAGATGAGKTTVADIILGLLRPDSGEFLIDGTPLDRSNVRSWQRNLSYVPQYIHLSDESVRRNIAFGLDDDEIDQQLVERAAGIAQILDFVLRELPEGFDTVIGERGVRLSGGEQQRIGIARALYRLPRVLVLDEATGALDAITENAVLRDIAAMEPKMTIIMITHRLSTLSACDRIYLLECGKVTASGAFADLVAASPRFADMAQSVAR